MDNVQNNTSVKSPERWLLSLRISDTNISFTLHSPFQENSMITDSIKLNQDEADLLPRIENAFYDYPLLVDDYKHVSVICDTQKFMVIPEDICNSIDSNEVFATLYPDFKGDVIESPLMACKAKVLFALPKGIKPFLERTYADVSISHSLCPLIEFFYKRAILGNNEKMFISLINNKVYNIIFDGKKLKMANVFPFRSADDAAFYILNLWQRSGYNSLTGELQVSGESKNRKEVIAILRKYIELVLPTIYPPALLRLNSNAMNVPFDLMLLSICE